jgi:DNA-binding response OmpR family regulator
MTETDVGQIIHPINVMLVLPGDEMWGAEQLRTDLATAGLRLMAEDEFRASDLVAARKPAAILVFLSGQLERDTATCRKWVDQQLAPVVVVSVNFEEAYVLAIFATGVEDVVQRPIKSRELAARIRSILRRTQPALLALEGGPASYKEGTAEEKTTGPTRLPVISAPPENKPTLKSSRIKSFLSGLHKHFSIKCKVN